MASSLPSSPVPAVVSHPVVSPSSPPSPRSKPTFRAFLNCQPLLSRPPLTVPDLLKAHVFLPASERDPQKAWKFLFCLSGDSIYDKHQKYLGCTLPLAHLFHFQRYGYTIILNGFHVTRWASYRAFIFTVLRISRHPKAREAWLHRFDAPPGGDPRV